MGPRPDRSSRSAASTPIRNCIQRRTKLVGDGRYEVVFQPVRASASARARVAAHTAGAIQRLRAVLGHRNQQRLILLVEVDRRAEMKLQHTDWNVVDD